MIIAEILLKSLRKVSSGNFLINYLALDVIHACNSIPWMLLNSFIHLRPMFHFKQILPLQMITNQLKERMIQGWLLYVINKVITELHCVKSVQIWSLSGPYFPVFSPNMGKYRPEKLCIWTLFAQCYSSSSMRTTDTSVNGALTMISPVISNVWLSMISGHDTNPIFFNIKNKDKVFPACYHVFK